MWSLSAAWPPHFCPSSPWEKEVCPEMSQLPLPELSLCLHLGKVEELPCAPVAPVGTSCRDLSYGLWYYGEHPLFSVWIWVQALLAKLVASPVQLPHGTNAICIMSCIRYVHNIAFLCKCYSTLVCCKPSYSSPQGQILPGSVSISDYLASEICFPLCSVHNVFLSPDWCLQTLFCFIVWTLITC